MPCVTGMQSCREVGGKFDDFVVADLICSLPRVKGALLRRRAFCSETELRNLADDSGGHSQASRTDGIDMAAPGPPSRGQQHLVPLLVRNDLFDNLRESSGPAVTDRLSSNLQDVDIREERLSRGDL